MTKKRAPNRAARVMRQPLSLLWTSRALCDLEAIGDYIARHDIVAAERWVMKLITSAEKAALLPLAGRRVPELARDDVREAIVKSYRIVYRVRETRVEVLTVFEGHRMFPDDLEGEER